MIVNFMAVLICYCDRLAERPHWTRKARDEAVLDPGLEANPAFQHGQEHPAE